MPLIAVGVSLSPNSEPCGIACKFCFWHCCQPSCEHGLEESPRASVSFEAKHERSAHVCRGNRGGAGTQVEQVLSQWYSVRPFFLHLGQTKAHGVPSS
jgi:hypothetical protein